jgi:hypothetical protein
MMCRKIALTSVMIGAWLVAGLACASAQTAPPPATPGQGKAGTDKYAGLTVRVSTDKTAYAASEPIKMTLLIHNTTKTDIQLVYNNGQKFDFEIRRGPKPEGPALWQWSRGMMFTMMVRMATLKAGETQTFTAAFEPKPDPKHNGNGESGPLSAGVYNITGILTVGHPADRPRGTTTFRIK